MDRMNEVTPTEFEKRKKQIAILLRGMDKPMLEEIHSMLSDFHRSIREKKAAVQSMKYRKGMRVRVLPGVGRPAFEATVLSVNKLTLTVQALEKSGKGKRFRVGYSLLTPIVG